MSDFLGEDFSLELDEILDPEQNGSDKQNDKGSSNAGNEQNVDTNTKPKKETKSEVEDDNDDPHGIDLSLAYDDPESKADGNDTADDDEGQQGDEDGRNDDTEESALDGSSSTISAFASALFEQGAFPDLDEEEILKVKTPEDLIALNRKQIESNELRDLTDLQKEALNAFRAGINPADFARAKTEEMKFDSITEEDFSDEDVAKSVIGEYLRLSNTPDDVIKDLIESYDIDEKLADKAKEALPKIKTIIKDNNKKYEQSIAKQREDAINKIKETLDGTKHIIDGIEITEKEKNELFNQMTKPAKILDDGTQLDVVMVKRQEDPTGFMLKLHYYAKLGLFDREVKSELINRKAKTNALKEFENTLNTGNSTNRIRGGSSTPKDNDLYDFDDIPDIKF